MDKLLTSSDYKNAPQYKAASQLLRIYGPFHIDLRMGYCRDGQPQLLGKFQKYKLYQWILKWKHTQAHGLTDSSVCTKF